MFQKTTIAIIDDDESVRVATESLVRSLGYGASTFASAEEFLQFPQIDELACLITDVQMPGMSGVELQTHLLLHGPSLPVIFMTAFTEERVFRKATDAGAICFLGKPFEGNRMIECIAHALHAQERKAY